MDNSGTTHSLQSLVQNLFGGHLKYIHGQFFTYREGCWVPLHEKSEVVKPIATALAACRTIGSVVR